VVDQLVWCICVAGVSKKNLYFCQMPLTRHSANKSLCRVSLHQRQRAYAFAECHYTSTRQRACTLPSADLGHSTKSIYFAECFSQALGKRPSLFLPPSRSFFFPRAGLGLGKVFAECPTKNTRQRVLCWPFLYRFLFAEYNTWQRVCRVLILFCRACHTLGKWGFSRSAPCQIIHDIYHTLSITSYFQVTLLKVLTKLDWECPERFWELYFHDNAWVVL
jgi:hypothetical protein